MKNVFYLEPNSYFYCVKRIGGNLFSSKEYLLPFFAKIAKDINAQCCGECGNRYYPTPPNCLNSGLQPSFLAKVVLCNSDFCKKYIFLYCYFNVNLVIFAKHSLKQRI